LQLTAFRHFFHIPLNVESESSRTGFKDMPKSDAVWGIDIGQCALKALRCVPHEVDKTVIVADQFDYIEYSKILSQPEADPVSLVREALKLFLSRNAVRGDHVAISVSGQSGLARFIKLPPVESSKIPDIVKYEARQQIPFSLDDVVWDYQQMAGGSENDGFSLETEVGLFAMKRDQVYRALKPLDEAGIEVDFIQLAPLAIYNALVFDQMQDLPAPEDYNPESPPPSAVVISLGTDNTDLVVTNGYKVWQRNIPVGGNHFTRALSKELKLTFAKAEHLKRNAGQAEDKKAAYQAMRGVFNDLLTEVQRSIGFYTGLDRNAEIGRVLALGNAMRLPGLQRYLGQHLGYDIEPIESYRGLTGSNVTEAPAFKENLLSFAVCYGLCLQGLKQAKLRTNLLPRELVTDRIIRDKKPWAVIALATLMAGFTLNYLAHWTEWRTLRLERYQVESNAFAATDQVKTLALGKKQAFDAAVAEFNAVDTLGQNLVRNVEYRILWLEVLKAIEAALPQYATLKAGPPENLPPIPNRPELHIVSLDCQRFEDLSTWYSGVSKDYTEGVAAIRSGTVLEADSPTADSAAAAPAAPPVTAEGALSGQTVPTDTAAEESTGPTGVGWVIELRGFHYYNEERDNRGATFVRRTFIKQLLDGNVELPPNPRTGVVQSVPIKSLGIAYPVIRDVKEIGVSAVVPNPEEDRLAREAEAARLPFTKSEPVMAKKFDFTIQFCWQEKPPKQRTPVLINPNAAPPTTASTEIDSSEPTTDSIARTPSGS
jgi:type IV pilus assembly protein PilM